MRHNEDRFRSAAALLAVAAGVACGGATGVESISKVEVTPSEANLFVQGSVALRASLLDASGHLVRREAVYWSSEDSTIASVSTAGVVTGRTPGKVEIAASAGGMSGKAAVTVTAVRVATVTVVPETLVVAPGESGQLHATAYDGSGNVVSGLPVTWGSRNPAVAAVDQSGTVTAVSTGTATVSAAMGGRVASATVVVAVPAPVMIAGCDGGSLNETVVGDLVVTGDIDNQCTAALKSIAGSIEIQGKVDHASNATLVAAAGIAIDEKIANGSVVQGTARHAFTLGRDIDGGRGPAASSLTVFDSDTLSIGGDVQNGAVAKLHSRGPIVISGAVHDPGTQVLWWAPSLTVVGGTDSGAEVINVDWGGF